MMPQTPYPQRPMQPMQPAQPIAPTPQKNSKRNLIIASIALLVIAVTAAVIFLATSDNIKIPTTPPDDEKDPTVKVLDDYITLTAEGKSFVLYDTFGETYEAAAKNIQLCSMNEEFKCAPIGEGNEVVDSAYILAEDGTTRIAGFSANASRYGDPTVVYAEADTRAALGMSGKHKFAIDNHQFITNETIVDEYVKSFDEVTPPSGSQSEYGRLYIVHYKGYTILLSFSQNDRTINTVIFYKDHPFISKGKKLEDIQVDFSGETFTLSENLGDTLRSAVNNCKKHRLYSKGTNDYVTLDSIESYLEEPYDPAQQAFTFAGGDLSYIWTMNYTEMPPENIPTRGDAKVNAFFRLAKSVNSEMTIDGHKIIPGVTTEKDFEKWIDNLTATYENAKFVGRYKNRYVYINLDKITSEKTIEIEFRVTPTGTF